MLAFKHAEELTICVELCCATSTFLKSTPAC